ncbi:MAG: acyloxyacyl hydrolase [Acidobacteriota bacterium]|nr:acyloxyacyl hydrolase [Acidobacteriota bacterium]
MLSTLTKSSAAGALVALGLLVLCAHAASGQAREAKGVEGFDASGPQNTGGPYGLEKKVNEFGIWGGGSFGSPTLIGTTRDTRLAIFALRYARVLARGESLAFKYTLDAVPVARLSFPVFEQAATPGAVAFERRKTITAAGLSPVGFQLNFRRRERVQPFLQTSGGFLYFGERIPDERGARFNFTGDFGGGVEWKTAQRRAWTFGYRYHHVSNGYRAQVNPGFDSNLFYVGISIFR